MLVTRLIFFPNIFCISNLLMQSSFILLQGSKWLSEHIVNISNSYGHSRVNWIFTFETSAFWWMYFKSHGQTRIMVVVIIPNQMNGGNEFLSLSLSLSLWRIPCHSEELQVCVSASTNYKMTQILANGRWSSYGQWKHSSFIASSPLT